MPYITEDRKEALDNNPKARYQNAGELTYGLYLAAINSDPVSEFNTSIVQDEVDRYLAGREIKYEAFAIVLGCLASCCFELERQKDKHLGDEWEFAAEPLSDFAQAFYEKTVADYEDEKINQNGDVLPCQHA